MPSSRHSFEDMAQLPSPTIDKAFCLGEIVVVGLQGINSAHVQLFTIDQMALCPIRSWQVQGEISCLSLFYYDEKTYVVSATVKDHGTLLSIFASDGEQSTSHFVGM
jgi:hypothetical protein